MKNHLISRFVVASPLIAACACLLTPAVHARSFSSTVHGARGGVYQRDVAHSPGSFSASGSATLPNGKNASRSMSTQRTTTGRTTTAQATGFNGKTASYQSTRTDTETGYVREASAIRPRGTTAAKQIVVSNHDGTVSRSVHRTRTLPKR